MKTLQSTSVFSAEVVSVTAMDSRHGLSEVVRLAVPLRRVFEILSIQVWPSEDYRVTAQRLRWKLYGRGA